MYYQFLDTEIVDVLQSIMHEANDYHDYVMRLGQKVCSEDVPLELAYLAAVHAWHMEQIPTMDEIALKHGEREIIKPWTTQSLEDRPIDNQEVVQTALDYTIESALGQWIEIEINLFGTIQIETGSLPRIKSYLERAKKLVESNTALRCFLPSIHQSESRLLHQEGNREVARQTLEEGLEIAKEFDNRFMVHSLLNKLGNLLKDTNIEESYETLEQAYNIARSLGYRIGIANTMFEMGKLSMMAGEYELAIKWYIESHKVFESSAIPLPASVPLNLSRVYSCIQDGTTALEWGKHSFDLYGPDVVWGYLAKARPLIILGKVEEATDLLTLAFVAVTKSGREGELAEYYLINGLCDIAKGELLNGMMDLKRSMEIIDRMNLLFFAGPCLIALTTVEMETGSIGNSDTSGPWMSRLEQIAHERNLPGILMEHALLKSKFQAKQGRVKEARKTLVDALHVTDSPGVATLRDRISVRINEMDLLIGSDAS